MNPTYCLLDVTKFQRRRALILLEMCDISVTIESEYFICILSYYA